MIYLFPLIKSHFECKPGTYNSFRSHAFDSSEPKSHLIRFNQWSNQQKVCHKWLTRDKGSESVSKLLFCWPIKDKQTKSSLEQSCEVHLKERGCECAQLTTRRKMQICKVWVKKRKTRMCDRRDAWCSLKTAVYMWPLKWPEIMPDSHTIISNSVQFMKHVLGLL